MKPFIQPLQLDENSHKAKILHKALAALGLEVDKEEFDNYQAGESTFSEVANFLEKHKIAANVGKEIDQFTFDSLVKEIAKKSQDRVTYTVEGMVRDLDGSIVKNQRLLVCKVNLNGFKVYKDKVNCSDVLNSKESDPKESDPKDFELIGDLKSNSKGHYAGEFYSFQFEKLKRKAPDLIVFAINEKENILGRSTLIFADTYATQGQAKNTDVLINASNTRTEFDILNEELETYKDFSDLAKSDDQISFLSKELDLEFSKIKTFVKAYEFRDECFGRVKKETSGIQIGEINLGGEIIFELLYGIGHSEGLNWQNIFRKTKFSLRKTIEESISEKIISPFDENQIEAFLEVLSECVIEKAMNFESEGIPSIDEKLSITLPEKTQRRTFISSFQEFQQIAEKDNSVINYKDFWTKYLPEQEGFKEDQGLIKSLLFNQQLHILLGDHLPLIKELQINQGMSMISDLMELSRDDWKVLIEQTGVPKNIISEKEEERKSNYIGQIQTALYAAYPTQKIEMMVRQGEILAEEPKTAKGIIKFLEYNPEFDFRRSRIDLKSFDFSGIPRGLKGKVEDELKRIQRIFCVSISPEIIKILLEKKLDSAHKIASYPRKNFISKYEKLLGGELQAFAVHQRAEFISARSSENFLKLSQMNQQNAPEYSMNRNQKAEVDAVINKAIPSFSQLIGSLDICECEYCKSVYSASAYFVELLRFLWRSEAGPKNGLNPFDEFARRRPDLLHLPLTCENANTLIPYIDLVNEIMEYYIVNDKLGDESYETGDIGAKELRAVPQNFNIAAYKEVNKAVYPFTLPYHQPMDTIRKYLKNLNIHRYDLLVDMEKNNISGLIKAIEAESLGLTQEEYMILTGVNFGDQKHGRSILDFYGNPDKMDWLAGFGGPQNDGIHELLRRTGIRYVDLIEIIKTKFINPHQDKLDFLENFSRVSGLVGEKLYSSLDEIYQGKLDWKARSNDQLKVGIKKIGVDPAKFQSWVKDNFNHFNTVILLYQPPNAGCNLSLTQLVTIGKIYEGKIIDTSGIPEDTSVTQEEGLFWSKLHRFIRLWRKLGWSISEVDLILKALGQTNITPNTISLMSSVVLLQKRLNIPISLMATFWGRIDTYGNNSLYKNLFLNKNILSLDKSFEADAYGNYLTTANGIEKHIPAILAAFRIATKDFFDILDTEDVEKINSNATRKLDIKNDSLTIDNLSLFYRYAVLSRYLQISISDICTLKKLFGINPFSMLELTNGNFKNIKPKETLDFVELATDIKNSGFKSEQLQYIFKGIAHNNSRVGLDQEKIKKAIFDIKKDFEAIEKDYPLPSNDAVTLDKVREKLSITFRPEVVNQLLSILDGTITISTTADISLVFNTTTLVLPKNYSYSATTGLLAISGIMTNTEQQSFNAIHSGNQNYLDAIKYIYSFPENFINDHFLGVLQSADVLTLLDHRTPVNQTPIADKLKLIYEKFIPLIKEKLRNDAIKSKIGDLVGLTYETITILLDQDIQNLVDLVSKRGFSGTYFSDLTFSNQVHKSPDEELNFPKNTAMPFIPGGNNLLSVRWKAHLSPIANGDYTFKIVAGDIQDSYKLFIDNELILDKTSVQQIHSKEAMLPLNSSKTYQITIEYIHSSGNPGIQLFWKTSTTALEIIPRSLTIPQEEGEKYTVKVKELDRAARFIDGFKLTNAEIIHFKKWPGDFDNIDFKSITPVHWRRMYHFTQFRNSIPQANALLTDVFGRARISRTLPTDIELREMLGLATGWNPNEVKEVFHYFGFNSPIDFQNEKSLIKIQTVLGLIRKTGVAVTTLGKWSNPMGIFDDLHDMAIEVTNTIKSKYQEEQWLKIAEEINNELRGNQRNAMIDYLLTRDSIKKQNIKDASGLFDYFLIDVKMGACMDTSRIVQANSAIQKFVNMILMNQLSVESKGVQTGVAPECIDKNRWQWMEKYRVWEVNRKIMITPENWLEPEWRDDKSPFFVELESELTQNDLTDKNVETAFRNYLTKLNAVANLDVCGMYQEYKLNGEMKMIHVFGRTHHVPYQFYYRTCDENYKWSAWDKVPLDIKVIEDGKDSGVHLVPVVWKNRLFLFWAEFLEKSKPNQSTSNKSVRTLMDSNQSDLEPEKYWEMRLAWSEYIDKKWSPKQVSNEYEEIPSRLRFNSLKEIRLITEITDSNFKIGIFIPIFELINHTWVLNNFTFLPFFEIKDLQNQILLGNTFDHYLTTKSVEQYDFNFQKLDSDSNLSFFNNQYFGNKINHKLLHSEGRLFIESTRSFFFSGDSRTYFVKPKVIEYQGSVPVVFNSLSPASDSSAIEDQVNNAENMLFGENLSRTVKRHNLSFESHRKNISSSSSQMGFGLLGSKSRPVGLRDIIPSISPFGGLIPWEIAPLDNGNPEGWMLNHPTREETISTIGLEFHTFYHPYASMFISELNVNGIKGLMECDTIREKDSNHNLVFNDKGDAFEKYSPNFTHSLVKKAPNSENYNPLEPYTYYKENICFDRFGANSMYNWEIFFHIPLYIATRLSKNGRYEEAKNWFHYIFDPTTSDKEYPGESESTRFWKTLPFKTTPKQTIAEWFDAIGVTANKDPNVENSVIGEWRNKPFSPFVIARNRPLAFMTNVLIKYVDNLRLWGDSLFRVFQREEVMKALEYYTLAERILGSRPEFVPKRGKIKAETYDSLKDEWDDFSNAVVQMENFFPYIGPVQSEDTSSPGLLGSGPALYFCIPNNEKLLELWDTIEDRLFKIRNCQDIDGVERKLALFAPPIDPAMLINAAAKGISLGSILSALGSPPPLYRFTYMLQKANEFCAEVKSLGGILLSVLEKKDGEELGRLRASHETTMLDLMSGIKERQVLDAKANKESLLKSREIAVYKLKHYYSLLTNEGITVPDPPTLEAELNSQSQLPGDTVIQSIITNVDRFVADNEESGVSLIAKEKLDLALNVAAIWVTGGAGLLNLSASVASLFPKLDTNLAPMGVGVSAGFGGQNIAHSLSAAAAAANISSSILSMGAAQSQKVAGYIRRQHDWVFQANMAKYEIIQLDKQKIIADIKIQISEKELSNHYRQIENSKQVELYLKDKFTNQELYQWMKEQLFTVYKQSYNLAFDMAKKAELCYELELGKENSNFIQYGYWENSMQGLCSGEKLQLGLKQLEKSFLEDNRREKELSKDVSLFAIDPLALLELKTTGKCFFSVPEVLFDLDSLGDYYRRIKSVSLSIPCIAGPGTSINCTLRLLNNSIRTKTTMGTDGYIRNNNQGIWIDDSRFKENNISVKSMTTSTAQRDSGMFELNFRDERYLPFEGAGVISEWKIELTEEAELRQFDYDTITDVIMHISFTAREDQGISREAKKSLVNLFKNDLNLSQFPLTRMLSLKHEFSTQWNKFLYPPVAGGDQILSVSLKREHFPFFTKTWKITLFKIDIVLKSENTGNYNIVFQGLDNSKPTLKSVQISMPVDGDLGRHKGSIISNVKMDLVPETIVDLSTLDIFKPFSIQIRHDSANNFRALNPDEILDLNMVVHYKLTN